MLAVVIPNTNENEASVNIILCDFVNGVSCSFIL